MSEAPKTSSTRRVRKARAGWSRVLAAALLGVGISAGAEEPWPHEPGGPHGPGPHWRRPPFDAVLEREAGRLGLDDAALSRIRAVADAARPESERLAEALHTEQRRLHDLLAADSPDRDAALVQVERAGAARTALEKQRIATMLEIRKLLTPEQRAELVKIFRERKRKPPE